MKNSTPASVTFALVLLLVVISGTAFAQNNVAPEPSASGTQILFLGTAGGPPLHLDRSEPSTLLIVDGRPYLIDCGIGTMRRMLEAGIASENIKTIFLTQLHADHDLGLADVMGNDFFRMGFAGSAHPINIYGPPQTKELVDAAFRYISISFRPFAAESPSSYPMVNGEFASAFATHEIEHEGVIFRDDKIWVTAAENSHYALMPPEDRKQMKSYSYRIETPHGVAVFTGDTGPSDAVVRLARGADVLVAEVSYRDPGDLDRFVNSMATQNNWAAGRIKAFRAHFQFEHLDSHAVGELASKAQVKSVLLYHYDPVNKADQAAYVSGVQNYFSGPVFAPDDLDRYCLSADGAIQRQNAPVLRLCQEGSKSLQRSATAYEADSGSKSGNWAGKGPLGNDPAKFDALVEAATLRNDTAFFERVLAPDVRFSHGTGAAWDKEQWLAMVPKAKFTARDLDSVEVEPHGDIVETRGHIHIKWDNPKNPEYQIWYVRVYARRNGQWQLLSNRTVRQVNGPMPEK